MQKDITIKYDKAVVIQPKIKRYDLRPKTKKKKRGMAPLQFIILLIPPILK